MNVHAYCAVVVMVIFGANGQLDTNRNEEQRKSYTGYKLLEVIPHTRMHLSKLRQLMDQDRIELDFWKEPSHVGRSVDVMVSSTVFRRLTHYLKKHGMVYKIQNHNVQSLLQNANSRSRRSVNSLETDFYGDIYMYEYHTYSEIQQLLNSIETTYPLLCKTMVIGKSFEKRDLRLMKISTGKGLNGTAKPSVWIDGGIHAREWIAPATAINIIHLLIRGYVTNDTVVLKMLNDFDWYILPISNPDGYVYTWTTDRMWRKTRSINGIYSCRGVDGNRNFDFHWRETGTSYNTCAGTYGGPEAFSEPETRAIADFVLKNNKSIKLFLQLHSYGQYWLTPWGYTAWTVPRDHADLLYLARLGRNTIRSKYTSHYLVGTAARMLYPASGGTDDWVYSVAGIKYAYTIELRDIGRYKFALPADYIQPTSEEIFEGIKTVTKHLKIELDLKL
ncbi:unnamed protein product [Owenia fusiformis]|uniref:Peptidase M14 domain-containing protein n=1 Tax=Owenia fusiformis TaxID=6347 RepID=A0A8J1UTV7_OWEFU|nr:unnamed protein product [Owenia fusiformis]